MAMAKMSMAKKAMAMKMASMKAMKMASMKMAMKKAMKVSKIGKARSVFAGKKVKTVGGLTKADLKKNKAGKIVSKKRSAAALKGKGWKKISAWSAATKKARKDLGIKGFCPVGGKTARGQALLKKVRSYIK